MNNILTVQMFGTFIIEKNGKNISNRDNHSRKTWELLAYLLVHHDKKVSQSELISAIWDEDDDTANPSNVFKVLLYRTRGLLNKIEPDLGKQLIISEHGECFINPEYPIRLDFLEFERNIELAKFTDSVNEQTLYYRRAINWYQGQFLDKYYARSWVIPLSTYYHNLYLTAANMLLSLYESNEQYNDIIKMCKSLCSTEQYEESFYIYFMRSLIRTEQYSEAVSVYQNLRAVYYSEFGITPSEELKSLFYTARQGLHTDLIDIADIPQLMHDDSSDSKALFCEIDIFKQIYLFSSRGLERNGNVIHLIMINITDIQDKELSKRSLSTTVKNLKELLCAQLRCGDIISMCSPSQFIILLPNANFENTQLVMQRIVDKFYRQYPHTPAKLNCYIQPISPITRNSF